MTISANRLHMATKVCSILRVTISNITGKTDTSQPVDGLSLLPCTPLVILGARLMERYRTQHGLASQAAVFELMVFDLYDIRKGDILTLDGRNYPINDVIAWKVKVPFMVLIVEDIMAAPEADSIFVR